MIKRVLALVIVILLSFTIVACSSSAPAGSESTDTESAGTSSTDTDDKSSTAAGDSTAGSTYEVGKFSIFQPEGWLEIPFVDFALEDKPIMDNAISLYKGAPDENTYLTYPGVTAFIYDVDSPPTSSKSLYDDATDIDPVTIDGIQWTGFSTDNDSFPFVQITGQVGDHLFVVMVATQRSSGSISLSDADVQQIISSLTPTE